MKKVIVILSILFTTSLVAQSNYTYLRTFGAGGYESAHNVSQTSDTGFIAAGWYSSTLYLYKVSKCGDFQWMKTYNNTGSPSEGLYRVIETSDGGFFATGTMQTYQPVGSAYDYAYLSVKFDGTGTPQFARYWQSPYASASDRTDLAYWGEEHNSGFITCGISRNYPWVGNNAVITNYTLSGGISWVRAVGANGDDGFACVKPTNTGFFAAGATNSFGAGGYDMMAVTLNNAGAPAWMFAYGTSGNEGQVYNSKGILNKTGGYILVGSTDNATISQGGTDVLVINLDNSGNVIWAYSYGSSGNEYGLNIEQSNNGYIISGYTNTNTNGGNDGLLLEIDDSGNLLWAKAIGDAGNDYGYGIVPVNGGAEGYMMSLNRETSLNSGNYDPMFARVDTVGSAGCNTNTLTFNQTTATAAIVRTAIPNSATTTFSPANSTAAFTPAAAVPAENFICLACTSSPPSFTMDKTVMCANEVLTIVNTTATPPACAQWTATGNLFSTQLDTVYATFNAGTYNIELTSICGNTVLTTSQTLVVNPAPTAGFTAPLYACETDTPFTYINTGSSGPNITYYWNLGNAALPDTSTQQNPGPVYYAYPGIKYIKQLLTNQYGCQDSITKIFHLEPLPRVNFVTDTPICITDSAHFVNNSSVGGTSVIATWFWNFGDGDTSVVIQPWHTYTAPGTYNVQLTATSDHGCIDSLMIPITVAPLTVPGFVTPFDTVCAYNNSGILTLQGDTGKIIYWQYSTDGYNWNIINDTSQSQNYLNLATTTYFRAFVQSGLCPGGYSDSTIVTVDMPSVAGKTLRDTTVCLENNNGLLTASGFLGQITNWEYSDDSGQTWITINSTNDTMLFSNLNQTRIYRYIVQNGVCPVDTAIEARVFVYKFNGASAQTDTTISLGSSVSVFADGGVNYAWFPNYNASDTTAQTMTVSPLETTQYNVIVYDVNGCMDTAVVLITVIRDYNVQISNVLTPNGDGYNDYWYIGNIENYPQNEVTIFNRFGKVLYTKTGYNNEWDGTYNGNKLPDGTYFYVIKFTDSNISFKGDINIINSTNTLK